MKNIILFTAIIILAAGSLCMADDGGASRLFSMGGAEIVIPDETSIPDLYSMGSVAGIFMRGQKSGFSLSGRLEFNNDSPDGQFFYSSDPDSNYFIIRPDANNAVIIKPYFISQVWARNIEYTNFGAGELQYALKFSSGISGGVMLRYARLYDYAGSPGAYNIGDYNKFEYMADAVFQMGEGSALSVAGGYCRKLFFFGKDLMGWDMSMNEAMNGFSGVLKWQYPDPALSEKAGISGRGLNLNVSFAYAPDRRSGISVRAGFATAGRESDNNSLARSSDWRGLSAALMARFFPLEQISLGAKADLDLFYDFTENPYLGRIFDLSFCAGAGYINGNIKVPLEIFGEIKQFGSLTYTGSYAGVRSGVEISATKNIDFRAGLSWPFYWDMGSGVFVMKATAGIGINLDFFRLDAGAAYGDAIIKDMFDEGFQSLDEKSWIFSLGISGAL